MCGSGAWEKDLGWKRTGHVSSGWSLLKSLIACLGTHMFQGTEQGIRFGLQMRKDLPIVRTLQKWNKASVN